MVASPEPPAASWPATSPPKLSSAAPSPPSTKATLSPSMSPPAPSPSTSPKPRSPSASPLSRRLNPAINGASSPNTPIRFPPPAKEPSLPKRYDKNKDLPHQLRHVRPHDRFDVCIAKRFFTEGVLDGVGLHLCGSQFR